MAYRLGWITDPHFNFLTRTQRLNFYRSLITKPLDGYLITGDIAESATVCQVLDEFAFENKKKIHFVLGNHDYYRSSISDTRSAVTRLCKGNNRLCWLSDSEPIELTPTTALIGHDGWYDGKAGNYMSSHLSPSGMSDFKLIHDFMGLSRTGILNQMQLLADESAEAIGKALATALKGYEEVILATHVPPFREAAWHKGSLSDDNWAPFFSNPTMGAVILDIMSLHPTKKLTCLVGHTHSSGIYSPLPNVTVKTGSSEYYDPTLNEIINIY